MVAATAARAVTASATPSSVDVVFDHPEKFADVKDSMLGSDEGRDAILGTLKAHIIGRAAPMLPAGYHLTLTFSDIHLAGDFEPWRGPRWDDVRIVRDIYPPYFKFTYLLTDASGRVVKQGSESIRDVGFQYRAVLDRSDPLRYEKDILTDWVHANLHGLNKS